MTPKIIQIYDWFEIQDELCKIMNIPKNKFRDYHEIVGGEYKDFWLVCLKYIVPPDMANGVIVTMYHCHIEWIEELTGNDEWKQKVILAWNKLYNSLVEHDEGIYVQFCW